MSSVGLLGNRITMPSCCPSRCVSAGRGHISISAGHVLPSAIGCGLLPLPGVTTAVVSAGAVAVRLPAKLLLRFRLNTFENIERIMDFWADGDFGTGSCCTAAIAWVPSAMYSGGGSKCLKFLTAVSIGGLVDFCALAVSSVLSPAVGMSSTNQLVRVAPARPSFVSMRAKYGATNSSSSGNSMACRLRF